MHLMPAQDIDILTDAWPRRSLELSRVREFITLYEDGGLEALPPLMVVTTGDRVVLYEGRHRYEALLALGSETALVQSVVLPDGRDLVEFAFEMALGASAVSALPLTLAEKRGAASRLLATRPDYADRQIARLAGLSHQTIGRLRSRSMDQPEDPAVDSATDYYAFATSDELANRLARSIQRIWEARGIGDRIVGDRAGKRLAVALRELHGDDAISWAERFASWGRTAVIELKRGEA